MKKIFVTGIKQESNSFNPLKSTYEDFTILKGQEMIEKVAGIKEIMDAGFQVVNSIYAHAVPAGTLELGSFLKLVGEMLETLPRDGSIDGVFIPMHGALDVEGIESAEVFIITKVREIVGMNIPISIALDLHANNTYTLIDLCNIVYGYRTAPHIDVAETHIRAAELLIKAVNEKVLPKTELIRIPIIMPGERMMTASGVGKKIIEFLPEIEKENGIWCASYFAGMTWIDCPQNGSAIVVSGIGNMVQGMEKAEELAEFIWDNRDNFEFQGIAMPPDEALEFALSKTEYPIIISDSADNVTAGAAGDNALFLNMLIKKGVKKTLVAAIIDPESVKKCYEKGIGNKINITVGGCFDKVGSEKAELKNAEIINVTKDENGYLEAAVLRYMDIDVLLFSKRRPVPTEEVLNRYGLSIYDYNITVVKQGYLTPQLEEIAKHAVMALTSGHCSQDVTTLKFTKLRRPMYPLDPADTIPSDRLFENSMKK